LNAVFTLVVWKMIFVGHVCGSPNVSPEFLDELSGDPCLPHMRRETVPVAVRREMVFYPF
jgi:hypothetical protein